AGLRVVCRPALALRRGSPGGCLARGVGSGGVGGRRTAAVAAGKQGQCDQGEGLEAAGAQGHAGGETVGCGGVSTNTPDSVMAAAIRRSARSPAAVPTPRTQAAITTRDPRGRAGGLAGCMAMPESQVRWNWVPVLWAKAVP